VGSHKAGKTAACPKCKESVTIPTPEGESLAAEPETPEIVPEPPRVAIAAEGPEIATGAVSSDEPVPLFDFRRQEVEVVYESAPPTPRSAPKRSSEEREVDFDRVSLPRYVLFVQGALLAVIGIVCFLLGMAVGGAVTESGGRANQQPIPIAVTGMVTIDGESGRTADAGAVVIFFPYGAKPDEKVSLVGVRPGDDPAQGTKFRDALRVLGGGLDRCDQRGRFNVQLPDRGRYYLLAISSNVQPSRAKAMSPDQIAQVGHYIPLSDDPLEEFRYQWRLESLRGSQTINVNFD
jgi:hypothetical protein